jgi:hypothetical protein
MLVTVAIFMLGSIMAGQGKLEERLFKHFTNEEIHISRATVIPKAVFDMHTLQQERDTGRIFEEIRQLRTDLGFRK